MADDSLLADDPDFRIRIEFDKDAGTLSVSDNGVGMTREEVVANLGTIAKSGTAEFLDRLTGDQKGDATLIGQFGVGFYSAFIVAKEVEVLTRRAGQDAGVRWSSQGEESFTVEDAQDLARGTKVTLTLKDDAEEFADGFRLRSIVRQYSDHIGVPVEMPKEGEEEDEPEFESVNSAKALWTRSRSEIEDDEYASSIATSRTISRTRWCGATTGSRAARIHQPSLCPQAGPLRPVESRGAEGRQALRPARVHHGRGGSVPAAVPALRARRGGLQRSAAQHLPGNPAKGRAHPHHSQRT